MYRKIFAIALAFLAGWGTHALYSAAENFFVMERNTRARKICLIAVAEHIDDKGNWPSSWQALSNYLPDQPGSEWAKEHIDIDFGSSLSEMGHQSPEAHVRTKGIALPEGNLEHEIEVLRRNVRSALGE